jgi:hypothetical protein
MCPESTAAFCNLSANPSFVLAGHQAFVANWQLHNFSFGLPGSKWKWWVG